MKRIGVGPAWWTALVAAAVTVFAGTLAAQDVTVYGTAGVDGNSTNIQLVGATARFGGLGIAPEVGLQGYHVGYDAGGTVGTQSIWAFVPSAGLSFRAPVGQVGARVGYSLQSKGPVPVATGVATGSGVVVSAQGNYWGPGPALQGITSYNFGSKYTWNEAQALFKLMPMPPGSLSAGPEVVWEGSTRSGGGNALELGPVVQWASGRNLSVSGGAGWKHYGGSSTQNDTWYAHVGIVKYGIHLGLF
jgi:hypothetical protein